MQTLRLLLPLLRGMPVVLLAALLLFSRLVAPSMAMEWQSAELAQAAHIAICHSNQPGEPPGKPDHPDHRACLLCPACHLLSHAAIPLPPTPAVPAPSITAIGSAAPLPPATGPPSRVRTPALPTGPPSLSA